MKLFTVAVIRCANCGKRASYELLSYGYHRAFLCLFCADREARRENQHASDERGRAALAVSEEG